MLHVTRRTSHYLGREEYKVGEVAAEPVEVRPLVSPLGQVAYLGEGMCTDDSEDLFSKVFTNYHEWFTKIMKNV